MLIAVMSDSHDNIWNIRKAVALVREKGAGMIIHCGDFVAPFTLRELDAAGVPVHGAFGNNDGDPFLMAKVAATECVNITLHGFMGNVAAGAWRVAFTHRRETAVGLAASGSFDLACYGHTHAFAMDEAFGKPLLNPGEVMGKDGEPGFCLVNMDTGQMERVLL